MNPDRDLTANTKRDAVAKALFRNIYGDACADDPTFPDRVWTDMTEGQRALYYQQADVALAASTHNPPEN